MMWERNTAVRYFITTRSRKDSRGYIGLMTAEDTFGKRIVTKISPVSKFYEGRRCIKITIMIINRKAIVLCYYSKIDKLKKMFEDKLKNNEERNHGHQRKY
jgi:peptide-methionine (S)-S-oxide reductase